MPFKARAVDFAWCNHPDCSFSGGRHLRVSQSFVGLENEHAIAISYTWGEFDRGATTIGHFDDGTSAVMTLGKEWTFDLDGFMAALQGICLEKGRPCWIDQLSIVQSNDAEVRATLASIPNIYRTFDVVVLLPGTMCECVMDKLEHGAAPDDVKNFPQAPVMQRMSCWNCVGSSAWFRRLWPRQELLYAQNIHAMWTSTGLAPCPVRAWNHAQSRSVSFEELTRLVGTLNIVARLKFKEWLEGSDTEQRQEFDRGNVTSLLARFDSVTEELFLQANTSLTLWGNLHASPEDFAESSREFRAIRFMRGDVLWHTRSSDWQADELNRFLYLLNRLPWMKRSTTQPRDLVIAVWTDCPKYELPPSYKLMTLPALLEDAIVQLERNWGISPVVSVPSALIDDSYSPETDRFWRPTGYLKDDIHTVWEVYRPIADALICYKVDSPWLMLRQAGAESGASRKLYDFKSLFVRQATTLAFDVISDIARHWKIRTMVDFVQWKNELKSADNYRPDAFSLFISILVSRHFQPFPEDVQAPDVFPWLKQDRDGKWPPELQADHVQFVERIVCYIFGLPHEALKEHQLRVMLDIGSKTTPPRLGLSKINWHESQPLSTYTVCCDLPQNTESGNSRPDNILGGDDGNKSQIMYEVCFKDEEQTPGSNIQMVGVWIQPARYPHSEIHSCLYRVMKLARKEAGWFDPDGSGLYDTEVAEESPGQSL